MAHTTDDATGGAQGSAEPASSTQPRRARVGGSAQAARRAGFTLAQAAEVLGVSIDTVRRRMAASGVTGASVPAPHGGRWLELTPAEVAVLRTPPPSPAAPDGSAVPNPTRQPDAQPDAQAGWLESLAEARAAVKRAEGQADSLRAALTTAQADTVAAQQRAEAAEGALVAAERRVADLRAAWWQWYARATGAGWWRRLRGQLPDVPPVLADTPRLPAPRD